MTNDSKEKNNNITPIKMKRLSKRDKEKMDIAGWIAVLSMCEREKSFNLFNSCFDEYKNSFTLDENILYRAFDNDNNEVGRFVVTVCKNDLYCLNNLIVFEPFRKKGYFKQILEYILKKHKRLLVYTSSKYLIKYFNKDSRFILDGSVLAYGSKTKVDNIYITIGEVENRC